MDKNLLDKLMYKSQDPTFQTEITPQMLDLLHKGNDDKWKGQKLLPRQMETMSSIQLANQALSGLLPDVSDFMTNLAMQESNIGGDDEWSGSYGPSQIDPIGYEDMQFRGKGIEGYSKKQSKRFLDKASIANKLLENMGYGKNFDILNLSLDEIRDPMINALLTRMKLGTIKDSIPSDLEGQADYWKDNWNTHAKNAKGKPEHFINQVQYYNKLLGIKTYDNTPLSGKNP